MRLRWLSVCCAYSGHVRGHLAHFTHFILCFERTGAAFNCISAPCKTARLHMTPTTIPVTPSGPLQAERGAPTSAHHPLHLGSHLTLVLVWTTCRPAAPAYSPRYGTFRFLVLLLSAGPACAAARRLLRARHTQGTRRHVRGCAFTIAA